MKGHRGELRVEYIIVCCKNAIRPAWAFYQMHGDSDSQEALRLDYSIRSLEDSRERPKDFGLRGNITKMKTSDDFNDGSGIEIMKKGREYTR